MNPCRFTSAGVEMVSQYLALGSQPYAISAADLVERAASPFLPSNL